MNQPRTQKQPTVHNTQTNHPSRGRAFVVVDSDEDAEGTAYKSKALPLQAAKATQNPAGPSQSREKAQPLFFDSDEDDKSEFHALNNDEDDEEILDEELNDDAMTLQSSTLKQTREPSARQTRSSKPTTTKRGTKKAPVIVDDDSDDGATFKGFRGKKKGTR
jgi:hypothetical protein